MVVGAGGAGMTAALAAEDRGLDTVLIEKSAYFGGSTARSGGGVWIPSNYALQGRRPGRRPETLQALPRLDRRRRRPEGPPRHLPRPRRRGHGLHQGARRRCASPGCRTTPTTTPSSPAAGRRAGPSEPIPLDARFLGDELEHLHPPYTKAPANLIVTQADFRKISLGLRTHPRPAHDGRRCSLKRIVSLMLRPADVRDGQRHRDRPPQGPDRRRRAGRTTRPSSPTSSSRTAASSASASCATASRPSSAPAAV